jgi:hypothetical protein
MSLSNAMESRTKTAWSPKRNCFKNGLDLSLLGEEKLQREDATAESVRGPTDWKSVMRKHREVLNISLDPPETKRILLKTKKFVNVFAVLRRKDLEPVVRKSFNSKKQ